MRQLLQQAEEVIVNFNRKIQADQRKALEAGAGQPQEGPEGPQGNPELDMKMQEFQLKQELAERKAAQEMDIKQRKAEQEIALKDAARAFELEGTTTNR